MMGEPENMRPMSEAPTNRARWLALWYRDKFGNVWPVGAHYAEGGGEEQPPFRGWFAGHGTNSRSGGWHQVDSDAIGWTEIEGSDRWHERRDAIVAQVLRDVCELPDRTSPDDAPDVLTITTDELDLIVRRALGQDI